MADFNVKITIRNNRILRAIRDRGFKSVASFSHVHGLLYPRVANVIRFKERVIARGEWNQFAYDLSSALRCEPEDLWPEHMRYLKVRARSVEFSTDEAGIRALAAPRDAATDARLLRKMIAQLPEREGYVLASRYGLVDGQPRSLEDVGASIGTSRQRVLQIECKAMNKIKDKLIKSGIKTARAFIEEPPSVNV